MTGSVEKGSQTARRALGLLRAVVAAGRPVTVAELAERFDLTISTTYRLMQTLLADGMVARGPDDRSYIVGRDLVVLSAQVMQGVSIIEAARPHMEALMQLTSETVSLHMRVGWNRSCVATVEGTQAVRRVIALGQTVPISQGPSGKVILAYLSPAEIDRILAWTEGNGADIRAIECDLQRIREQGYMASVGDRTPGVGGLSVPLFDSYGATASLTVSGPAERWNVQAMTAWVPELVAAAKEICGAVGVQYDAVVAGHSANGREVAADA